MRLTSTLCILATALAIAACSKSGDPVTPGATATNTVKYSVNRGADQTTAYRWAEGSFNSDSSISVLGFSVQATRPDDDTEADGMIIAFNGQSTGTSTVGVTATAVMYRDSSVYIGTGGTLVVSKYGNIGQTIEGTLTARMISFSFFGGPSDTLDVKEFRFSAKRIEDNQFNDIYEDEEVD